MTPSTILAYRRLLPLLLVILIGVAPVACSTGSPRARWHHDLSVDHDPGSRLEVVNANGAVRAVAEDRDDIEIEAELYGRDLERLSFAVLRAERMGDGSLRVWIDWPGGRRSSDEGARIDVYSPGARGVKVTTSNGSVTLLGFAGDALVETTNGSILVEDQRGRVEAFTTNGNVRLDRPHGAVTIQTTNGRVLVDEAHGPVEASSSNGRITVSTTHPNPGPVRVRTTNGSVSLELGESFRGRLQADTSNGGISVRGFENPELVESSKRTLKIQIGDDDTISRVITTNGSISVRGRRRE